MTATGRTMTLGRRTILTGFASALALAPLRGVAFAQDNARPGRDALYRDHRQPVDRRVEDLLGRMTLEEKVAQMIGVWETKGTIQNAAGDFQADKAIAAFPNWLGQISRPQDTTFEISGPRLAQARIGRFDKVRVEVDVVNTGARAGDEVVQLYVRDDFASVTRPVLELKHFQRVTLEPGARTTVAFEVTPRDLSFWNIDMERVVEPGTFTISAGPNSRDLKSTTLEVSA